MEDFFRAVGWVWIGVLLLVMVPLLLEFGRDWFRRRG